MALFGVEELVEMAVKDEETGIAFYRAVAQTARSAEVRQACLDIQQQEVQHAARFREMLREIGGHAAPEQYAGEYEEYVRALLDSRAFPAPELAAERARQAENDADAIDLAMGLERDTLLFLQEMRNFIPSTHTACVEEIINEERGHLTDLARLKASLG